VFTTLNKTMAAWVTGVIAAEYVLHLVPEETHDWEKFISPQELVFSLEKCKCLVVVVGQGVRAYRWIYRLLLLRVREAF